MESCCCPGNLSGSRCRFLSSGISAREAHGFPLSLLPGCQCLAPALQATGVGRRVHKETAGGLVWQSSAFQRLFGGVRSAPQTEPHGHTMGCPTPPPQQAEGASPWIPAASLQTGRNPGWHWEMPPTGLGPPAQGAHTGCGGHLRQTTAGTQQGHTSARAHPCANPLLGPMGLRAPTARHLPVPPEPLGNPRVPGTVMPTWARTSPVPTAPSPSLLPRHSALSLSRSSSLFPEQLPDTYLWHSQHFQKHIKMKEQICLAGQEEGKQTAPVHTQCPGWDSWPGLC